MNRSRKIKFWNSMLFRITAGILLLGISTALLLYFLITNQMSQAIETQITSELQTLKTNTEVYVRQFLLLNDLNNDEECLLQSGTQIAEELYNANHDKLLLYDGTGNLLLGHGFASQSEIQAVSVSILANNAWKSAREGNPAYDIIAQSGQTCHVYFTMPLSIAGKQMGFVSYYLDYSTQYAQNSRIGSILLNVITLILLLITLIILAFLSSIIRPLRRLSTISNRVSQEIKTGRLTPDSLFGRRLTERKDELGMLAVNYRQMLSTINSQFTRIQNDRDNIRQLLESKQEFYNNVTHELKTPLTTIKGYAQLLEENGMDDPELFKTAVLHIQHESTRLHQMVIELLEMSDKALYTQLVPINVSTILNSVVSSISLKAKRYQNTILIDAPDELPILGKEDRIRQLFINLLDNAIKYGAPGRPILVHAFVKDDIAEIQVINEGDEIPAESIGHLFDPFYRVDKEQSRELGSAGLGLSICQKIAEEHHAMLTVSSKPKENTIFTIQIPLCGKENYDEI